MQDTGVATVRYEFHFPDSPVKVFPLDIDMERLVLLAKAGGEPPPWTALTDHQCPCCPLPPDPEAICPLAASIARIVDAFADTPSFDQVHVRCITADRTYAKDTSVQDGLYSILGLVMATSGCPVMQPFKPMARFHLPFSTVEETMVRAISFYLLGQYFRFKEGHPPDLGLKELDAHYSRVQQINESILQRIRAISSRDADRNAMTILHSLAQMLSMEIDANLSSLEPFFTPADPAGPPGPA
ncbi:MAG: hypothetical protein AB1634_01650 [Thermodesulfobacteriota bacterium]